MTRPWLSVAMPIHEGMRDLPATLASVAGERPDGIEFLIYDSSHTGACQAIVDDFRDRLSLRYLAMPDMTGWPDKTNLAITHASADHVSILHQDDLWLEGHVEAVRASIAAEPDAVMHVAGSGLIDVEGRAIGQWSLPLPAGMWSGEAFGRALLVQNFLAIPSPVIKRDAWLAAGGMDPALWYSADWDLYLKLAGRGAIAVRPKATTAFRIHGNSLTMTGSRRAQSLREQLSIVLERHGAIFASRTDRDLLSRAAASAAINCHLADAAAGHKQSLWAALRHFLSLGPVNALRYVHESRIADRVLPRLRARFAGVL